MAIKSQSLTLVPVINIQFIFKKRCCNQIIQRVHQSSYHPIQLIEAVLTDDSLEPRSDITLVDLQIADRCLPQSMRLASLHQTTPIRPDHRNIITHSYLSDLPLSPSQHANYHSLQSFPFAYSQETCKMGLPYGFFQPPQLSKANRYLVFSSRLHPLNLEQALLINLEFLGLQFGGCALFVEIERVLGTNHAGAA